MFSATRRAKLPKRCYSTQPVHHQPHIHPPRVKESPFTPEPLTSGLRIPESARVQANFISEPLLNLKGRTKNQIIKYFENTWNLTETLFKALASDEVLYETPDKLRHPLIFYLGHPAIFYVNKMALGGFITDEERINPFFEDIFAIGVDEMSWDDYSRPAKDWPDSKLVWEYRSKVHELVIKKLQQLPVPDPIIFDSDYWVFPMSMDHERIHVETSSCLMRQLPVEMLKGRPEGWPDYAPLDNDQVIKNEFIEVPATPLVEMGKPMDFPTYGWDNEYGKRCVAVPGFRAMKYKTTNAEFLRFIEEGGYANKVYWSEEGWKWKSFIDRKHPLWWKKEKNGEWKYRTVWHEIEMPWNWPVDVNYHEAKAFCNWRGDGCRLVSEAEWHVMRGSVPKSIRGTPEEEIFMKQETIPGNTNIRYSSSSAVNKFPPTEAGFYDVFGNVWEWCEDHNDGFPGFRKHPHYSEFSDPCFDSMHNIIQGGSWVSTGCQASVFGRFAFRRHFMQHAGFRVAQTVLPVDKELYGIGGNPHVITVNHWLTPDGMRHY